MAARERIWSVSTNWSQLTEAERAAVVDHASPAIVLAWCRAGELEASGGLASGGGVRGGRGDRDRVDGAGHGGDAGTESPA